jgi:hypothetical protein
MEAAAPSRRRVRLLAIGAGLLAILALGGAALAVVGGDDADGREWSWVAQVREDGRFTCTGSLVAPDWVLTAAHCLYGKKQNTVAGDKTSAASRLSVLLGETERRDFEPGIAVRGVVPHPLYDGTAQHDVALLHLTADAAEEPVELAGGAGSLDLAGRPASIVGWGATVPVGEEEAHGFLAPSLQRGEVTIASDDYCEQKVQQWTLNPFDVEAGESYVAGGELCTRSGQGADACFGDSGGPLFVGGDVGGMVGVVHGDPRRFSGLCSRGLPTLYARVDSEPLRSWILDVVEEGSGLVVLREKHCVTGLPLPGISLPQRRRSAVQFDASLAGGLVVFRDAQGTPLVGPRRWHCRAAVGVDGTEFMTLAPTPVREVSEERSQAISLLAIPACAGCMAEHLCTLFPDAPPARFYAPYEPCRRRSRLERAAAIGPYEATFEDPPGVEGQGILSGGPNAAIGQLVYSRYGGFAQVTCVRPPSSAEPCRAVAAVSLAVQGAWRNR